MVAADPLGLHRSRAIGMKKMMTVTSAFKIQSQMETMMVIPAAEFSRKQGTSYIIKQCFFLLLRHFPLLYGSFHVKSTRKMDTHHRFCRNLVSTYHTLSDELAWNFSPWTCMFSELQAFQISNLAIFCSYALTLIDRNLDMLQVWEVGQQFSESMWNVLSSNMLN